MNDMVSVRPRRIYYVHKPEGEKDLLIFDGGYPNGNIYVYDFQKSIESNEIMDDVRKLYPNRNFNEMDVDEIVSIWVDKKFGYAKYWDLK